MMGLLFGIASLWATLTGLLFIALVGIVLVDHLILRPIRAAKHRHNRRY